MMSLLVAWMIMAGAEAPPLPALGLRLNESLRLVASDGGFKNDEFEIQIQSIKMPSPGVARQKATTDLFKLENLYKPQNNPYQGQVSQLVECGPSLLPKVETIHPLPQLPVKLLVGGVSARGSFGVCAPQEIALWGGFFQFYHAPSRSAVEVRIFLKKEKVHNLAAAQAKISRVSRELFR